MTAPPPPAPTDDLSLMVRELSAQNARLLDELMNAEERERSRIAVEIHDDTAQVLGAVSLRLEKAQHDHHDELAKLALGRASEEVREAAVRLRGLMFEVMAPGDDESLHAAIASYCAVLLSDSGIEYSLEGDPRGLSLGRRMLAYRLAQEALRNVVKHAEAKRVEVRLASAGEDLILTVSDDGVGLDETHDEQASVHAGLRMIQHRAEAAGGGSRTGVGLDEQGTSIEIRIPLHEEPR